MSIRFWSSIDFVENSQTSSGIGYFLFRNIVMVYPCVFNFSSLNYMLFSESSRSPFLKEKHVQYHLKLLLWLSSRH